MNIKNKNNRGFFSEEAIAIFTFILMLPFAILMLYMFIQFLFFTPQEITYDEIELWDRAHNSPERGFVGKVVMFFILAVFLLGVMLRATLETYIGLLLFKKFGKFMDWLRK